MRQNDRWEEVAGLVVRFRDAGVVGFDLAGPEIGFPPDRIPSAIGVLDGAHAHRTIHAGEADGIDSIRAALDGARSGWGTACGSPTRCDDGRLGPGGAAGAGQQVTLEIAPSSNVQTGAYPSLAAHPVDRLHRLGFAVTLNTDNRLMSGVSASSEIDRRREDVRLVVGRRADGHRAGGRARVRVRRRAARLCWPTSSVPGTPRYGRENGHPACGNHAAILAANLGVPAHRPVILPDMELCLGMSVSVQIPRST